MGTPATTPEVSPPIPTPPLPFGVIWIVMLASVPSAANDVPDSVKPAAATLVSKVVALTVVNVAELGAVPPITGGLDKSKAPPKVRSPEDVTVPDREIPDTVPVPPTAVTVPTVTAPV